MKSAWLGLGGNIGDVRSTLASALQGFGDVEGITVAQVSPLYKTPPWGVEDQPWFLNCCCEILTELSPEALLEECQVAERTGKRERIERWGPRTIDIDILIYDGVEQIEQRLVLPHPRIEERAFVLIPLADIAPELMLNGLSIREHASAIDASGVERESHADDWWR